MCLWRLEVNDKNHPSWLIYPVQGDQDSQSNSELCGVVNLPYQITLGILFSPLKTGIAGRPSSHPTFIQVLGVQTPVLSAAITLTTEPLSHPFSSSWQAVVWKGDRIDAGLTLPLTVKHSMEEAWVAQDPGASGSSCRGSQLQPLRRG